MSLVSLQADINERRLENDAIIVFEDQYAARKRQSAARFDPQLIAAAKSMDMTPEELFDLRRWIRRVTKECKERLAREMTLVYTLNEPRDRVLEVELTSKMKAADKYPIPGGDLLDLEGIYGGVLVRGQRIYVSQAAFEQAATRYENDPVAILNGLIAERCAA